MFLERILSSHPFETDYDEREIHCVEYIKRSLNKT